MNAIVIGAGVDELVAARLLARAGHKVLVLDEQREKAGETEGWIARELGLEALGLRVRHPDPWIAAPLPGGGRLELWQDIARSVESIRGVSARDAERWPEFCTRMARAAALLEALYLSPPPDPVGSTTSDLAQFLGLAFMAHRSGRQAIEDLLRLLPMPVADLLDDWFESDILKGLLASGAIGDLPYGPRAGGTALALLHRHVGSPPGVFRPPVSNAVEILRPGTEVRNVEVARLRLAAKKVAGVLLKDGEELSAALVLSGVGPQRTLLELLEPGWLDPELARAVRLVRNRGSALRPSSASSLDDLERASDTVKYGGAPTGQWGAELALDQFLWMRPVPALARYATPIEGLYLCGQAMHPGAGIPGLAGLHCAREVLRDAGRRKPA
jgi:phytoene dehydrogenase-like protein